MDVTDMIDFNVELINLNDPCDSYFHLSRDDPTIGFSYDAFHIPGHTYPPTTSELPSSPVSASTSQESGRDSPLYIHLVIASHLAKYLRHQLWVEKGYTCSAGISTSKLLAKLAGEANKPDAQTTILPPYEPSADLEESNVTTFLDALEVGRIPGIGFKLAQKLRNHVLGRPADFDMGHVEGETKEKVLVRHVRCFPSISPETLGNVLGGPGAPQGIGGRIWGLLNGVDDTEVVLARKMPKQISIEDSYRRLDTLEEVKKELDSLAQSLIRRMHVDLLEDDGDPATTPNPLTSGCLPATGALAPQITKKRWIAHPRTLRLTTLPRHIPNTDNTNPRPSSRTSRSCPTPSFLLSLTQPPSHLATKLVSETLLPLFRKLHPKKSGWDLSIVNGAVVNMGGGGGWG
jgi:DNA polymerase iota